jgi:Ca-activated chloride channel family protein
VLNSRKLLFLIYLSAIPIAHAEIEVDKLGGRVEAVTPAGDSLIFPTLKTDIEADIQGDLATVTVQQTFENPLNTALNVTYRFPLNKEAAVYKMIMEVGDEVIHAQIKKVEEAQATFDQAKQEGKSAALLKQHRPNMFTQEIANLMPGLPIKVTLHYVQTLPKVDNVYELVIPLVVGPRFQPPHAGIAPSADDNVSQEGHTTQFGQWELDTLPTYPPVKGLDIPKTIDAERVAIHINLNGGMPIQQANSRTHQLDTQVTGENQRLIRLAKGRVIDNQDFVLRYSLGGDNNQAGLLAHQGEQQGFFSLLIEPPAIPQAYQITPREMVFVLDCSGSMRGLPLDASKAFMREALQNLRPTDMFRIIRFSESATEFSRVPLPATASNIQRGIRYTDSLHGSGGTRMREGVKQALGIPVSKGTLRLVTFLTDGYIGNEHEILRLIKQLIGSARLFALGVGSGLNRFLLSEMAHIGRGFTRYMDPTEDVQTVAKELAQRLQSPVLTDITVDWGELQPTQIIPQTIPDLFAGQTIRIQGRYAKPGRYVIEVKGRVSGRAATLPLEIRLPQHSEQGEAIALIWARSAIQEKMRLLNIPKSIRSVRVSNDDLKQQITQLGLDFSLVTRWTAFVAVSKQRYNPNPVSTLTSDIPLPMVKGVTPKAYGNSTASANTHSAKKSPSTSTGSGASGSTHSAKKSPSTSTGSGASGSTSGVPEPAMVFGLLLVMIILGWFLKNRLQQL